MYVNQKYLFNYFAERFDLKVVGYFALDSY